jgi:hypothetical protein
MHGMNPCQQTAPAPCLLPFSGASIVYEPYAAVSTFTAAGASGSGKTYTMLGNKDNPGLANRIIDDVFALYDPRTCTVAVAIEELYNVSTMMCTQDSSSTAVTLPAVPAVHAIGCQVLLAGTVDQRC